MNSFDYKSDKERIRQEFIDVAYNLMKRSDWFILDTETTGLGNDAQMVEIAVYHPGSEGVVLNTLVKPSVPISSSATDIHGISDDDVKNAPSFREVYPKLCSIFERAANIVIYNSEFDLRIINQTCTAHGLVVIPKDDQFKKIVCSMMVYSAFVGSWNSRHRDFRWQKLPGGNHRALSDCIAV